MRSSFHSGTEQNDSEMKRFLVVVATLLFSAATFSQNSSLEKFLADSVLNHASVSLYIADAVTGEPVAEYNSTKSLNPGSVLKLVTTAAALEILGPEYTFKTRIAYTGTLNKRNGKLTGDIIITGGGDPCLGSNNFPDNYNDFITKWIGEIKRLGIKKIEGRVITDDSYYDYQPVPGKWLWEDAGNYYGAGAYGLSVFDNTCEIHINTAIDSLKPLIIRIVPEETRIIFHNHLTGSGSVDKGYVYSAPYSNTGWIEGTVPVNREDFILKASITDPPMLLANIINQRLEKEGIKISGEPGTFRLEEQKPNEELFAIAEISSPPLSYIIEVLNHESVNLYAEHLVKEMGKKMRNSGTTDAGIEVIMEFLNKSMISTTGMFIDDGSGLSPLNSINAREHVNLLIYMKSRSNNFDIYFNSLPEAGKEGTLKNYFKDPLFESNLKAKSGSMTRVRSYAGYFKTLSGRNLAFSIIVNNYTGSSKYLINNIEEFLKGIIINK